MNCMKYKYGDDEDEYHPASTVAMSMCALLTSSHGCSELCILMRNSVLFVCRVSSIHSIRLCISWMYGGSGVECLDLAILARRYNNLAIAKVLKRSKNINKIQSIEWKFCLIYRKDICTVCSQMKYHHKVLHFVYYIVLYVILLFKKEKIIREKNHNSFVRFVFTFYNQPTIFFFFK